MQESIFVKCFNDGGCASPRFHLWPIASLFVSALAFANGSPIARSDLGATGNIRMIQQHDVQLRRETLQVRIEGDWALVRAEYELLNQGAATTVAYGFPVDYINPDWCNDCGDVSDGEHLRDVRIEADGDVLETKQIADPKPSASESPPQFLHTWIVSELPLREAQQSIVTVSYRVRNEFADWSWSTNFMPSHSTRKFRYRLSPSGNWGRGKVGRLDISVDFTKLAAVDGKINKIAPAGYTRQDGVLRWQLIDVDLSKSADLEIEYDDSARLLSEFMSAQRLSRAFITQASASSTLDQPAGSSRHSPAMMLDGDLSTAWCEGAAGDGAGQTLTFEFAHATTVTGVGIVNGYTKSPGVFAGNGRVRNLSVTTVYKERSGQAATKHSSASLPARDYGQLNRRAHAGFVDWIDDFSDLGLEARSMTFTLDATTPGAKHPDTCISEIYFIGYPP